jgi:hypothetical protein
VWATVPPQITAIVAQIARGMLVIQLADLRGPFSEPSNVSINPLGITAPAQPGLSAA